MQQGVVERISISTAPISIVSTAGDRAHCKTAALQDRCELSGGLTNEEREVKNCMVTQLFVPEAPTVLEQAQIAAKRKHGAKVQNRATDVYRENGETYVGTLYEDMDTGTLPFARFLERHAFQDDLHKKQRMADIAARHALLRPPAGKALRKRKHARQSRQAHRIKGVSALALLTAMTAFSAGRYSYPSPVAGDGSTTQSHEGGSSATPSRRSWLRPGVYHLRGTPPAPTGGTPGRPAGPGLPSGGASADYD